jgi:uncharacterized protein
MTSVDHEFLVRAARIPFHGLGLSVDVYTPDLFDLVEELQVCGLTYGYLEIFKASQSASAEVRRRLPGALLEYHAEGLWVSQPRLTASYPFETELDAAIAHLATLGSDWMNHECASKQMAGYSFGTYLPPIFTAASADVTAENAGFIQRRLAKDQRFSKGREPLLLLEIPPLTYFAFGDLSVPNFFRRIVAQAPCGLVLDIGHVWTIYRYTGERRRRGLHEFMADFLDRFPLERVVQIHVAGLAEHGWSDGITSAAVGGTSTFTAPPHWIDAHGAPIPEVLFDMLTQVLDRSNLIHLKGIALEVDTKPISQIVAEYERFCERLASFPMPAPVPSRHAEFNNPMQSETPRDREEEELSHQYRKYVAIITGQMTPSILPSLGVEPDALDIYLRRYLPHEILEWGGNVTEMFPETCRELAKEGVTLLSFVDFWFQAPRWAKNPYDFFLLKLDRFVEFVQGCMPDIAHVAVREAEQLRDAYQTACEPIGDESLHVHR